MMPPTCPVFPGDLHGGWRLYVGGSAPSSHSVVVGGGARWYFHDARCDCSSHYLAHGDVLFGVSDDQVFTCSCVWFAWLVVVENSGADQQYSKAMHLLKAAKVKLGRLSLLGTGEPQLATSD